MSKKLEFADIVDCNSLATRKVARRITQIYDASLAPSGIRSTQMVILAALSLRAKNPPTLSELADSLVLDRSALGHNLRPLERDGFIELQENQEDRRQRHLILTREGKAKLNEAFPLWVKAQESFSKLYGEKGMAELRKTLEAIAHDQRLP
ncbi:MAG: MarR family transcriptional regulator [Candidatus Obscuribacterales bacterium]|nr:MarR family transcriptional regulator [Candidatus Obscuribacterales bacterium]